MDKNRYSIKGKDDTIMRYNFDEILYSKKLSMKWEDADKSYNGTNLLPMWIADMDFSPAPAIASVLKYRSTNPYLGYRGLSDKYYQSIIDWFKKRFHYSINREWILPMSGITNAIGYGIRALTSEKDEIIIMPPVYPYFKTVIENNGRVARECALINENGFYKIDFDLIERSITSKTKMIVLCSPHNPVGRVWSHKELERLASICKENHLFVISDEIHCDIIFKQKHTIFSELLEEQSIVCTAPTKSFNIAGVPMANILIPNSEIRDLFCKQLLINNEWTLNTFASDLLVAAYNDSEEWLDCVLDYINKNIELFVDYVKNNIPNLKCIKPEGTYFVWVDFSGLNMSSEALKAFLVDKCKLAVNYGGEFGEESKLFARFNLACSEKIVVEALNRLENSVNALSN